MAEPAVGRKAQVDLSRAIAAQRAGAASLSLAMPAEHPRRFR